MQSPLRLPLQPLKLPRLQLQLKVGHRLLNLCAAAAAAVAADAVDSVSDHITSEGQTQREMFTGSPDTLSIAALATVRDDLSFLSCDDLTLY